MGGWLKLWVCLFVCSELGHVFGTQLGLSSGLRLESEKMLSHNHDLERESMILVVVLGTKRHQNIKAHLKPNSYPRLTSQLPRCYRLPMLKDATAGNANP